MDENSPASRAGLKVGDVVLKVDGREIKVYASFLRWVAEANRAKRSTWKSNAATRYWHLESRSSAATEAPMTPTFDQPRCKLPQSLALALCGLPGAGCRRAGGCRSRQLPRIASGAGRQRLRAFAPVSEATRHSIVKFNVDGATVALGAVVDTNGLVLTKASELKKGKLTCWLATEQEGRRN